MIERPRDIHPVTWRVLCALRDGVHLSRNKNFRLFRAPRARRGLRLFRYLQSVARDIREYGDELIITEANDGDHPQCVLRIEFPLIHGRRTAYLRYEELEMLAEDEPRLADLVVQFAPSAHETDADDDRPE